jgi:L,D-transpeptidase YbiS
MDRMQRSLSASVLALCAIALACACACGGPAPSGSESVNGRSSPEVSGSRRPVKLDSLQKQVRALEDRVRKLETAAGRQLPGGPVILVDTAQSRISLVLGSKVVAQGACSTGSGMELKDSAGKRTWTFDTPRGHFRVLGKVENPVWFRPDWSYIEEGEPIPRDVSKRATPNVLGDYAIAFGNGYYIHGTLYTRLLGANVTHGCIRVDDATLQKLYAAARPGTPIWIF